MWHTAKVTFWKGKGLKRQICFGSGCIVKPANCKVLQHQETWKAREVTPKALSYKLQGGDVSVEDRGKVRRVPQEDVVNLGVLTPWAEGIG